MPTIDCGHWNGRRNRLPHLAGSIVWRSRWGRRFRLPVEADFHRSSKSRKRLCPRGTELGSPLPATTAFEPACLSLTCKPWLFPRLGPRRGALGNPLSEERSDELNFISRYLV